MTSINISVCPAAQWLVHLEEGVSQEVAEELRKRGHKVNWPITGTEEIQILAKCYMVLGLCQTRQTFSSEMIHLFD